MIVRPRPNWLLMMFVWRGSVLRRILPQLLCIAVLSLVVNHFNGQIMHWKVTLNPVPMSLLGITLAIFLSFRNSASYDRYWEARKLWGTVLNEARTLTRQSLTLVARGFDSQRFGLGLVAFSCLLKHHLRGTSGIDEIADLVPDSTRKRLSRARFVPAVMLLELSKWLRDAREAGQLDPVLVQAMEPGIGRISDAMGGCERILNTPLPFTYVVMIHRTVYIYCLLLPFALVDTLGDMAVIMSVFIGYTFLALEALGDEIEEPFGMHPNDLALNAMTRQIEITVRELLDDEHLPPPVQPDGFVLT